MHNTGELETILKSPVDNDSNGNTIAHLAAEGGHASVFKVYTYNVGVHIGCNLFVANTQLLHTLANIVRSS